MIQSPKANVNPIGCQLNYFLLHSNLPEQFDNCSLSCPFSHVGSMFDRIYLVIIHFLNLIQLQVRSVELIKREGLLISAINQPFYSLLRVIRTLLTNFNCQMVMNYLNMEKQSSNNLPSFQ